MNKHVIASLLCIVSSSAWSLDLGQCGLQRDIETQLASEGQQLVASGVGFEGKIEVPVRITSRSNGTSGYYLRGKGRGVLCVTSVLSDVKTLNAIEIKGADVCALPTQPIKTAEICLKVKQGMKGWTHQRTIKVNSATSSLQASRSAVVRFGFCNGPSAKSVLCSITETRLN